MRQPHAGRRYERDAATRDRLEHLRGEVRAERISWGELHELQSLSDQIDPFDVELLEAAGVSEADAIRRQESAGQEYDDEPAALRFVQEPYRGRIVAHAQERGGVADIAVGFDELAVRFGDGTEEVYR